jgi:hypothetical protein
MFLKKIIFIYFQKIATTGIIKIFCKLKKRKYNYVQVKSQQSFCFGGFLFKRKLKILQIYCIKVSFFLFTTE